MALRRIKRELRAIVDEPPIQCTAEIVDEDYYHWKGSLKGPHGTPYENGIFYMDIRFPLDYPFSPPKIVFTTKIFHPNINDSGNICLDILKDNWSPVLTITKIILSISSLLSDPNPDDPLVNEIAELYRNDYDAWFTKAEQHTRKWAGINLTSDIDIEEGKTDIEVDEKIPDVIDIYPADPETDETSSTDLTNSSTEE